MLLTLTPRHFDQTLGKAHAVPLRHPQILDRINGRSCITLWLDGRPVEKPGASVQDVAANGDGRCHLNLPYETSNLPRDQWCGMLWVSLPGDIDPRSVPGCVVVELSEANASTPTRTSDDGPLLIIGPQRSGTTALQTALDASTRYRAPRDVCMHAWNTLEGFFSAQSLWRLVSHPFISPFASQSVPPPFRTGVFDDCAMADAILDSIARHVDEVFRLAACGSPCWIDKSPGWEPVILAPLFRALFPTGRVIFMTRRPESCVLSIIRLEGRLTPSLSDPQLVDAIGRNSAVWVLAMYLWRTLVKPLVPSVSTLVLSMEAMQRREAAALDRVAVFLDLNSAEASAFATALDRVPLPRHANRPNEVEDDVSALVSALCKPEAERWDLATALSALPEHDAIIRARAAFERRLRQMIGWIGFRQEFIPPLVADMAGPAPEPPPATESEEASMESNPTNADANAPGAMGAASTLQTTAAERPAARPAAPPVLPAPGPLLAARLAREPA